MRVVLAVLGILLASTLAASRASEAGASCPSAAILSPFENQPVAAAGVGSAPVPWQIEACGAAAYQITLRTAGGTALGQAQGGLDCAAPTAQTVSGAVQSALSYAGTASFNLITFECGGGTGRAFVGFVLVAVKA